MARIHTPLKYSGTVDPASIATGALGTVTVACPGARTGDVALASLPSLNTGLTVANAYVSAADTVTIALRNTTGGAIDDAEQVVRVAVFA